MSEAIPWETIEAFLLDLDGTLIETDNRWAELIAARLTPLKRIFPHLDTNALGRKLVMSLETPTNYIVSFFEHLGLGSSFLGLADRIRRSKGLATKDAVQPVEGTMYLSKTLAPHFKLAIVTTRARPETQAFLRSLGCEQLFEAIITRQDVLRMKPHPEPIRKAAALLRVPTQHCVMVGDTAMDILSARRAGAYAIGVLSGFGMHDELKRAGAQLILNSAVEILNYLPTTSLKPR
ncbi:MAG: HAD family hydrolase [Anaerolineae bacterium]|nr:HAD family hydrolase [Anaerolineae bacterium]